MSAGKHRLTFEYQDEQGTVVVLKDRVATTDAEGNPSKRFYPLHHPADIADATTTRRGRPWAKGLPARYRHLLYHLPDVLEAVRVGTPRIYWAEGERDADALVGAGQVATTSVQTGDEWWAAQAEWFKGYTGQVVICVDNDDAGAAQALGRYRALRAVRVRSRLVRAAVGKDVREQLGLAGTQMLILADDASLWADYKALIRRARVLADAKVAPLPRPGDGDRS